jgi:hypothetical protein
MRLHSYGIAQSNFNPYSICEKSKSGNKTGAARLIGDA